MIPSTEPLKENAIQTAARWIAEKPVYIDTETTGLEKTDEIVEFSIVDFDGSILYSSLVKPSKPIPTEASRIHGITNEMVSVCSKLVDSVAYHSQSTLWTHHRSL